MDTKLCTTANLRSKRAAGWGVQTPAHARTHARSKENNLSWKQLEPPRPQTDAFENDGASRCVLGGGGVSRGGNVQPATSVLS